MKISNLIAVVTCLFACVFACWATVNAQQEYPTTGHNEFAPSDVWSVSTPVQLDQARSPDSDMSPDHWGSSASLANPDSYLTEKTTRAWDGILENHPWITNDGLSEKDLIEYKRDAIVRGGATNQPVGSNSDTNANVPLPPSASRQVNTEPEVTTVPMPPSKSKPKPLSGTVDARPSLSPSQHYPKQPEMRPKPVPNQP